MGLSVESVYVISDILAMGLVHRLGNWLVSGASYKGAECADTDSGQAREIGLPHLAFFPPL